MNGPRSILEPLKTFNDRDIWSSEPIADQSNPGDSPKELLAAARRLQETLVRCGCMEKNSHQAWTRRPLRPINQIDQ